MKFRIFSDLHLEFAPFEPGPMDGVDCVVLAGDIGVGTAGLNWAERVFEGVPVVYVPGNHEYYGHDVVELNREFFIRSGEKNVDVLVDGVKEFPEHKVAVVGGTLWTDFDLNGRFLEDKARWYDVMNDARRIDYNGDCMEAQDVVEMHYQTRYFMGAAMEKYHGRGWKVVVVSHHAPSSMSCDGRYKGDVNNVYFASDGVFDDVDGASLWVHGHCHEGVDYEEDEGMPLVVSNPRGYPMRGGGFENPRWVEEGLVVNGFLTAAARERRRMWLEMEAQEYELECREREEQKMREVGWC